MFARTQREEHKVWAVPKSVDLQGFMIFKEGEAEASKSGDLQGKKAICYFVTSPRWGTGKSQTPGYI